jgi:hypothetical protein
LPIFLNLSALAVAANFQPCNTLWTNIALFKGGYR